ncbi:UbiD family decarboxylase [Aminobacter aminovorans]|uniref:4-hydroxy-3-polyprenylbenzoate decarboxylase n=1 Tax=Aminobacter aminovorans TaxID=83263 RepID=A0AAC9FD43_AMIAI|nr:UbiD family decarboxylase [Aminobacter aminovorans]AMS40125.1 UbiD family decarboxylase [Aminobacter aminovorans]MBB3710132.1 4-hydroxy-3-polyprenylbenzoate decarboxylase [Aminobacter aminovorans]
MATTTAATNSPLWRDLREWIDHVQAHGQVQTISPEVDPVEELSAITFLGSREVGAPAFLFETLKGNRSDARVLTNMLGASKERYALTVGLEPTLSVGDMVRATRELSKRRIPPILIDQAQAPVMSNTLLGDAIDLTALPAPKFWPGDGGAFIGTGNVTFIRNPENGVVNAGVYRQMLHGPRSIGINMVPGRHGALNRDAWWARGEPCPVVIAYGIDPALFIAATQAYAHDDSEIDAAGGLKGNPVELTGATLSDMLIPARAEMVLEGFIHPGQTAVEGPLGEFHGYYSGKAEMRPVISVEALHYRPQPIMTAALMATYPSCEIGEYHAIMRAARVWDNLEAMGVPGINGVYVYPAASSAAGLMVVSLKQMYPGHTAQVLALAAQSPAAAYCVRWVVAVDDYIEPCDINQVMWAMSVHCNPSDDIDILRKTWSYRTDPSLAPDMRPYGSKALIDACENHRHRSTLPKRALLRESTYQRVAERWDELGLKGRVPQLRSFHQE